MTIIINLTDKFNLFQEPWHPKIVGELNDSYVKLAKLKGEFVWHHHDHEDELFLVVKGMLVIKLRNRDLTIHEGEFVIIPKGVEHLPVAALAASCRQHGARPARVRAAKEEVHVLLLEPKSTLNTGNVQNKRTVEAEWI